MTFRTSRRSCTWARSKKLISVRRTGHKFLLPFPDSTAMIRSSKASRRIIAVESGKGRLYRDDPQLESFTANLKFSATNEYFANTEGSVLRKGRASYGIEVNGSTQEI